jgi:hypothetical protein
MLTEQTAEAMKSALREWERAIAWRDTYQHEDVLGEYSEKVKQAHKKVVQAARMLAKDEPT